MNNPASRSFLSNRPGYSAANDTTQGITKSPSAVLAYLTLLAIFTYHLINYIRPRSATLAARARKCLYFILPHSAMSLLGGSHSIFNRSFTAAEGSASLVPKHGPLNALLSLSRAGLRQGAPHERSMANGYDEGNNISDEAPPGLGNWDNSCYQNSVLQALASINSFPDYLDTINSTFLESANTEGTMKTKTAALHDLLRNLNDLKNSGRLLWTPSPLKSMSSWQQQDAQEYFSKILDEIDREVIRYVCLQQKQNSPGLRLVVGFNGSEPSNEFDKKPDSLHMGMEPASPQNHTRATTDVSLSSLRNPLEGLLAQRVGCLQCGWSEGLSMIPFICLTLPLGSDESLVHSLEDCLDEYTELELIRDVECARCTLLKSKAQLEHMLQSQTLQHERPAGTASTPLSAEVLHQATTARLEAVNAAIEDDDFSEATLLNKCKILPRNRVAAVKTRQAVIARAPKSLVIHINRSRFDEFSGAQRKNYTPVRFPDRLDLGSWCLGSTSKPDGQASPPSENWILDPAKSMLPPLHALSGDSGPAYEIRAVITHYGQHENGHYICYRKHPWSRQHKESREGEQSGSAPSNWWRLSDDDVSIVTEEEMLMEGSVFMLFYDRIDTVPPESTGSSDPINIAEPSNFTTQIEPSIAPPECLTSNSIPQHRSPTIEEVTYPDLASPSNLFSYENAQPTIVNAQSEDSPSEHLPEHSPEHSTLQPSSLVRTNTVPRTGYSYNGMRNRNRNRMASGSVSSLVMAN